MEAKTLVTSPPQNKNSHDMAMKQRIFLESLFDKYWLDLHKFIATKFSNRNDAEDIAQEAFHKILNMEDQDSIENPKAYLFTIANNLALGHIRKEKYHSDYVAEMTTDSPSDEASPERSILAQKDLEKVEKALVDLPEKYRKTFILSRVQHKSYKEISQELEIPVSTVEKHIIKVLKYLRDHVSDF